MITELNVKFKEAQRGVSEDVYYCAERKRCYIRQKTNYTDPPAVFWLTCTKGRDKCGWSGYEASSPIRAGITIKAIGPDGQYFEETLEDIGYDNTRAIKVGKFSWELEEKENHHGSK